MPGNSNAVFLSYASEDTEAAERIATALRSAGIEVWFDKSELRGGDAWDRQIRQQIHDCRLFMPLISANSERRDEGYFRREWKLAVDRTHDMADQRAFLVPVVIDDTTELGAFVPDKFLDLQWTRLTGGECTVAFVERVRGLMSRESMRPARTVAATSTSSAHVPPQSRSKDVRRRWPMALALAIAVAGAVYFTASKASLSKRFVGQPVQASAVTELAPAPIETNDKSVAVLPLKNESGDPKQEYFSDGLSEDLITALSHVPELKVIGRTSSFHFKNSQEDSASIGRQLGVTHLIEGSVRRDSQTIRVNAELIRAVDGRTLWSERYDRSYKNLFALQDEITQALAQALKAHLVPSAASPSDSDRPPSGNLEAYAAYKQGHYLSYLNNESQNRQGLALLMRATELDPKYFVAWSQLENAWLMMGLENTGAARQDALAKARAAAEMARKLAPDSVPTHQAWGDIYGWLDFDQRAAEAEYRRALELAPQDPVSKIALARAWATLGRLEAAVTLTRDALAADPLKANGYVALAGYLAGMNRLDEAEQAIRKGMSLEPAGEGYYSALSGIFVLRGDAKAALEAAHQEVAGADADIALAQALAIGSDRELADAALKTSIDRWADTYAYSIAETYALRHDPERMFQWLDRAWAQRDFGITTLLFDPPILRYKSDPRLAAYCRKVGLPTPAEAAAQNKPSGT